MASWLTGPWINAWFFHCRRPLSLLTHSKLTIQPSQITSNYWFIYDCNSPCSQSPEYFINLVPRLVCNEIFICPPCLLRTNLWSLAGCEKTRKDGTSFYSMIYAIVITKPAIPKYDSTKIYIHPTKISHWCRGQLLYEAWTLSYVYLAL